MFKKILVPIDGSDASLQALKAAARMAEKFGSEVMLFHVMQLPSPIEMFETYSGKLGEIYYQIKDRIEKYGRKVLESGLKQCEGFQVTFKEKAAWGEPASEISRKRTGVDTI